MQASSRLSVKGTQYYKARALFERGALSVGTAILLEHQRNNPHDKNAVTVKVRSSGDLLGHVSREVAQKYAAVADDGRLIEAKIVELKRNGIYINILIQVLYQQSDRELTDRHKRHNTPFWESVFNLPSSAGVYSIRNTQSGRQYVGSSVNLKERVRRHINELSTGRHHNHVLQVDFSHYGPHHFEAKLLDKAIYESSLARLEEERISSLLASGTALYNMTIDGQGIGHKPLGNIGAEPVSGQPADQKVQLERSERLEATNVVRVDERSAAEQSTEYESSPDPKIRVMTRDHRYIPGYTQFQPRGATPLRNSQTPSTAKSVVKDDELSLGAIKQRVCKSEGKLRYQELVRKAASNRRLAKKAINQFSKNQGLSAFKAAEMNLLALVQKALITDTVKKPAKSLEWLALLKSPPFSDEDLNLLINGFAWATRQR